jgi:hypothetical protein
MHDAAREVSDNIIKNTIPEDDAGNDFIKRCFENRKKTYEYKEESRLYNIHQSQLSHVFHYEFLKIGEAGFTAIPHDMT